MELYIPELSFIVVLFFLSAFFSGSETALFSLSKAELHKFSISAKSLEKRIASYMSNSRNILISILIGNLFTNLLISAIGTKLLMIRWPESGHFISIAIITPFMILLCEITPKIISINSYESISKMNFPFLMFFHKLFFPLRVFLLKFSDIVISVLKLKGEGDPITENELEIIVKEGEKKGIIKSEEANFIDNILHFSKKDASNVMFPRNIAVFIPYGCSIKEAMEIMLEAKIIRVPVFKDDTDHVIGMIDSRELMPYYFGYKKADSINRFIHDIQFFPESRDLNDLLKDFLEKRIQVAIALDEYGGTAGVITLNSIIFELMGKNFSNKKLSDIEEVINIETNFFTLSGDMQLDDFNRNFSENLSSNESDTIGGFIIEQLGHIPKLGDQIELSGYFIEIKKLENNIISIVEMIDKGKL